MEIILSEKDIGSAIKLYLAYSGVTRSVASLEFARKLRGDDAGISVSLDLEDAEMSAEELSELAMSQSRARGLNNKVSEAPVKRPGGMSQLATEISDAAQAEPLDDEEIPFTTAIEDAQLAEDPEPIAIEATAVEGNELPEGSPFADTAATADVAQEDTSGLDFDAPDTEDPFADSAPVVPESEIVAVEEPPAKAPINLFG